MCSIGGAPTFEFYSGLGYLSHTQYFFYALCTPFAAEAGFEIGLHACHGRRDVELGKVFMEIFQPHIYLLFIGLLPLLGRSSRHLFCNCDVRFTCIDASCIH